MIFHLTNKQELKINVISKSKTETRISVDIVNKTSGVSSHD